MGSILGEPFLDQDILLASELLMTSRKYFESYIFVSDTSWNHLNAHDTLKIHVKYPNLIMMEWVQHHYGLVLCKLAAYIRMYPCKRIEYWTPSYVLGCLIAR